MLCFLFGHKLPPTTLEIAVAMNRDQFQCSRCFHFIDWKTQPKSIQRFRDAHLRLVKNPNI